MWRATPVTCISPAAWPKTRVRLDPVGATSLAKGPRQPLHSWRLNRRLVSKPTPTGSVFAARQRFAWTIGDLPSALRLVRRITTGRINRRAEFAQGLGADQQRIVEVAAVDEVDLHGTLHAAQA